MSPPSTKEKAKRMRDIILSPQKPMTQQIDAKEFQQLGDEDFIKTMRDFNSRDPRELDDAFNDIQLNAT